MPPTCYAADPLVKKMYNMGRKATESAMFARCQCWETAVSETSWINNMAPEGSGWHARFQRSHSAMVGLCV